MNTRTDYRKACRLGHLDCIGINSLTDECQQERKCSRHQWMDLYIAGMIEQQCGRCGKVRA